MAVVRINFSKVFVQRMTQDARVSASMRLSSIGGTLGLFTG